eukprot:921320-Pyramimonas_sp.AAC.1
MGEWFTCEDPSRRRAAPRNPGEEEQRFDVSTRGNVSVVGSLETPVHLWDCYPLGFTRLRVGRMSRRNGKGAHNTPKAHLVVLTVRARRARPSAGGAGFPGVSGPLQSGMLNGDTAPAAGGAGRGAAPGDPSGHPVRAAGA